MNLSNRKTGPGMPISAEEAYNADPGNATDVLSGVSWNVGPGNQQADSVHGGEEVPELIPLENKDIRAYMKEKWSVPGCDRSSGTHEIPLRKGTTYSSTALRKPGGDTLRP